MPLFFLLIGVLLVATAVNNSTSAMFALVRQEFSGKNADGSQGKGSFIPWLISIVAIGSIGYIPKAKHLANFMLVFILLVLVLSNQSGVTGFFSQFQTQVNSAENGAPVGNGLSAFLQQLNTASGGVLSGAIGAINGAINGVTSTLGQVQSIENNVSSLGNNLGNLFGGAGGQTDDLGITTYNV